MWLISDSIKTAKKSGLHNPFKNPERYKLWGTICTKLVELLNKEDINGFIVKSIQNVMPKSII